MDKETAKRIVRQQRAGYARLHEFEIEEARRATFADRLDAFTRIMQFAEHLPADDSRKDDDEVTQRWILIRERYAAKLRAENSGSDS